MVALAAAPGLEPATICPSGSDACGILEPRVRLLDDVVGPSDWGFAAGPTRANGDAIFEVDALGSSATISLPADRNEVR